MLSGMASPNDVSYEQAVSLQIEWEQSAGKLTGKWQSAVLAYQKLISQGQESGDLYYRLGMLVAEKRIKNSKKTAILGEETNPIPYFEKSKKHGSIDAIFQMGVMFLHEDKYKNIDAGKILFKEAADNDHALAMAEYCHHLEEGIAFAKDIPLAMQYYQKFVDTKQFSKTCFSDKLLPELIINAKLKLAEYYQINGTPKQKENAFIWLFELDKANNHDATYHLAHILIDKGATETHPEARSRLYNNAIKKLEKLVFCQYSRAELALGHLYLGGCGIEPNLILAEYYLLRSAQTGYVQAVYQLAQLYKKQNDIERAYEMLEKAVRLKSVKAKYELGRSLFYGENLPDFIAKDEKKGFALIDAAAIEGCLEARTEFGVICMQNPKMVINCLDSKDPIKKIFFTQTQLVNDDKESAAAKKKKTQIKKPFIFSNNPPRKPKQNLFTKAIDPQIEIANDIVVVDNIAPPLVEKAKRNKKKKHINKNKSSHQVVMTENPISTDEIEDKEIEIVAITKIIIPDNIILILQRLNKLGFYAYVVGGFVRDEVLHKQNKYRDIDIVTNASEAALINEIKAEPNKFEPQSLFNVISNGMKLDIWRNPELSESLKEDYSKRDFTINALYAKADGVVIDPTGKGLNDLLQNRLQTTIFYHDSFLKNPSCLLRYTYFLSQGYEGHYHQVSIKKHYLEKLHELPKGKLHSLLCKHFMIGKSENALRILNKFGIVEFMFPALQVSDESTLNWLLSELKNTDEKYHQGRFISKWHLLCLFTAASIPIQEVHQLQAVNTEQYIRVLSDTLSANELARYAGLTSSLLVSKLAYFQTLQVNPAHQKTQQPFLSYGYNQLGQFKPANPVEIKVQDISNTVTPLPNKNTFF